MLIEIIVKNEKGEVVAKKTARSWELAEGELGKLEAKFKDDYTLEEDDEVDLSLEEKYWGYMPNN